MAIPYINGLSEKFSKIGNRFNRKTVFKTKTKKKKLFRKMKLKKLRDKPQCVYRIPCRCGTEYIRQTDH
jgi:hypothetical protein